MVDWSQLLVNVLVAGLARFDHHHRQTTIHQTFKFSSYIIYSLPWIQVIDVQYGLASNTSRYFSVLIENVDVRCSLISSRYSSIFEDVDVVPHRLRASMFLLLSWAAPWTVLSNYRLKGYISIRTCTIPCMQVIPQFPNMDADQELRLLACELSVAERMHLLYHLSTTNLG